MPCTDSHSRQQASIRLPLELVLIGPWHSDLPGNGPYGFHVTSNVMPRWWGRPRELGRPVANAFGGFAIDTTNCSSSSTTTTVKSANPAGSSYHSTHCFPSPPPLFQNAHDTTISGNAHLNVAGRDIIVYGSQSSARAGTSKFILYSSILPKLSMTSSTPRLA